MESFLGLRFNKRKKILVCFSVVIGFNKKGIFLLLKSLGVLFSSCFFKLRKVHYLKLQSMVFLLNFIYGKENIKKLIRGFRENLYKIRHRKALRFFKGLPVRGQRTRTNAKTASKNK